MKVIDKIANSEVIEKDVFQRRADLLADYKKNTEQIKDKESS